MKWNKFMLVLFFDHELDWCPMKTLLKLFDATLWILVNVTCIIMILDIIIIIWILNEMNFA